MGLNIQALKFLLAEREYRELEGRILLVGRSTVTISPDKFSELFKTFGLPPPRTLSNKVTRHQGDQYFFDDLAVFESLANKSSLEAVDVLDVSAYEGANIIHDLNTPAPPHLVGRYDFIYDSSVTDNLFNPAQAILNYSKLLKPRGRYVGINVASFYPGAMVSCHPEWFFSFFAVNNFVDVKVYLTDQQKAGISRFEYYTNLYRYTPHFTRKNNYDYLKAVKQSNGIYYTLVVAEKGAINDDKITYPTNLQYISSSNCLDWSKFQPRDSSRPVISGKDSRLFGPTNLRRPKHPPHLSDHYSFIGAGF